MTYFCKLKMNTIQSNFRAVSISHKSAPVAIREAVSLGNDQTVKVITYLKEFSNVTEALILSTCNRTEVYYVAQEDKSTEIIKLLGIEKSIQNIDAIIEFFTIIEDQNDAMMHLFEVAIGLNSQVVGDIQISNQVKRAYQISADTSMAGPFLHRLMHTIFFTHKKVVQETSFRDGAASVSYAAAEMIKEIAKEFLKPRVLIVGLGEIGIDVCRNLIEAKSLAVTIANRTQEKAEKLSAECGFDFCEFDQAIDTIENYDIVISSVATNDPIIKLDMVKNFNGFSHKYFFDLSVPRSIEEDVENLAGIIVYNIDDINSKTNEAVEQRLKAIPQVKSIIQEAMSEFSLWSSEMAVSPTINRIKGALEEIRLAEISRTLKGTDIKDAELIDKITKNMMQKIIKLPVLQLKAACKRGDAESLIDVLNELFDLEKSQIKNK